MNDPESYCPFCKKTHDAPEFIEILERLQARVEDLEGMEHKYGDEYFALKKALDGKMEEPHPDHCLCDDCVTPENMEERLEISRKFMEQANSEVEK